MVNREDVRLMKEIIVRLGIVGSPDEWTSADPREIEARVRQALTAIQGFVRCQLDSASLQDLQSQPHRDNDDLSDGLIRLSGINPSARVDREQRKGNRSITNLTMVLQSGLGDCRETMSAVGCLFATYQSMLTDALLNCAQSASLAGDRQTFTRMTQEVIPEVLRYEVRGGHMGVYAGIAMKGLYDAVTTSRDDVTAVERRMLFRRGQRREDVRISPYEQQESLLVVAFTDGCSVIVEPQKNVAVGDVPAIPGATPDWSNVASIELRNKVEQHTMTFLHIAGRNGELARMELADAFYNERFAERGTTDRRFVSPYQFGTGAISLDDYTHGHLFQAGEREVSRDDGTRATVPVYLRFLPYSKTEYVRSLGEGDVPGRMRLLNNDIAVPERAVDLLFTRLGKNGRRDENTNDRALSRVREWYRRGTMPV
jgi:hypothetical protein